MDTPRLRRALADLGFALLIIRRRGSDLVVDDLGPRTTTGLRPLAIVWDDDPGIVRARVRGAIRRLPEAGADTR